MARTAAPGGPTRVHHVFSLGAKLATAAAAFATVLGYVHSVGLDGSATRRTMGTFGAVWVGIAPAIDTLWAIGDSIHLAATVTDKHGTALVGSSIAWSSSDTQVVSVDNGIAVAHSSGAATVVAAVGELLARARVIVRPRPAAVHVASDSAVVLSEGTVRAVSMRTADARGHILGGYNATWHTSDSAVATVDTSGRVTGVGAGHATLTATVGAVSAQVPVSVVPVPGSLSVVSGSGQDGAAGNTLPVPVIVRLLSQRGRPLGGIVVHFRRGDVGGAVDLGGAPTDAEGRARTVWRLGDIPGRQRLLASVDGLDSTAVAEAEAEPVPSNTRAVVLHDAQRGAIATSLTEHVGLRLTDSSGRPLVDVPVSWSTLDGGSVTSLGPRSDSLGDAEAAWVLGPRAGRQRLLAAIGNGRLVKPVLVHATATPGPPVALVALSGNGQHAFGGASLPKPLTWRVSDAAGNAVPNVQIVLKPAAGAVADSAPTTDSSGVARARWTLPVVPAAGAVHLMARVEGIVQPVDVMATVVSKPPARPSTRSHHRRS